MKLTSKAAIDQALREAGIEPSGDPGPMTGRRLIAEVRVSEDMVRRGARLGLSRDEVAAVRGYTSLAYGEVNEAYRSSDPKTLEQLEPVPGLLDTALEKLPAHEGPVHRVSGYYPELDGWVEGRKVTVRSPWSTSVNRRSKGAPGEIEIDGRIARFDIQSESGRAVDFCSAYDGEKEVLFPAGSQFRVLRRTDYPSVTDFVLKEC